MNRKSLIQVILMALFMLAFILLCIWLVSAATGVGAGDLPEGIEYPDITVNTDCISTQLTVSYWEVDPEVWGDEWASETTISYMQNATAVGDVIQYGEAFWYLNHHANNQITIEVTSNLYRLTDVKYTYVETLIFTPNSVCTATGDIEDVTLTPIEVAHLDMVAWNADYLGQQLAQISIAKDSNGAWQCDEVVDVTIAGSLFVDALDLLCQQQADAFNSNNVFMPIVIR